MKKFIKMNINDNHLSLGNLCRYIKDISNNKISNDLINYIEKIRDKKQVIIVTHNPLLVVNLDVDNVIHLTKNNDVIEVKNGSLEYEDENYSILDLVKENLDGGYDAIERRLKAYGKDKY